MPTLAKNVLARYLSALDMTTVTVEHLEKWKKDLRMLTKIYKAVDTESTDRAKAEFIEARDIFRAFVANWEKWVYKVLLPKVKQSEQSSMHKQIASKAWDAKVAIDPGMLFPTVYDNGTYVPAPWELRNNREKNITKYNRAFNAAFKEMEMFIEWNPTKMDRVQDEVHNIAGATVIVEGFGRGDSVLESDVDKTLRMLAVDLGRINQAGFGAATKGLVLRITFESNNLRAGQYDANKDEITLLPLGMGGDTDTLTHEIGHRFWYRAVPAQAQARWEEVVESRSTEITSEDVDRFANLVAAKMRSEPGWSPLSAEMLAFAQQVSQGEEDQAKFETMANSLPGMFGADYRSQLKHYIGKKVLIDGVSDYATTNPKETFAEVFMGYVVHGPGVLTPFMRQLFRDTCRSGARFASIDKRVAQRFGQRMG